MKDSDIKAVAEALLRHCIRHSVVDKVYYCSECDCEGTTVAKIDHSRDWDCAVGIAEKLLEEMK